jgi:hypothetical protein
MVNVIEQVYHLLYSVYIRKPHFAWQLPCTYLVDDVTLITFLFQSILTQLLVLVINVCLSCVSFLVKTFHGGTGMVKSIATTWCRGNTVETVYCHDICRGNKEKIVYCHDTPRYAYTSSLISHIVAITRNLSIATT